MIENLPRLAPDTSRGATTMAKCHDRLAVRRRRIVARNRQGRETGVAERLLLAGLCVVYLVSMAGDVLSIVGAL